jgi:hypothetical protein
MKQKTNKRGSYKSDEDKRTHRFVMMLTGAELKELWWMADEFKKPASVWAREVISGTFRRPELRVYEED